MEVHYKRSAIKMLYTYTLSVLPAVFWRRLIGLSVNFVIRVRIKRVDLRPRETENSSN